MQIQILLRLLLYEENITNPGVKEHQTPGTTSRFYLKYQAFMVELFISKAINRYGLLIRIVSIELRKELRKPPI